MLLMPLCRFVQTMSGVEGYVCEVGAAGGVAAPGGHIAVKGDVMRGGGDADTVGRGVDELGQDREASQHEGARAAVRRARRRRRGRRQRRLG